MRETVVATKSPTKVYNCSISAKPDWNTTTFLKRTRATSKVDSQPDPEALVLEWNHLPTRDLTNQWLRQIDVQSRQMISTSLRVLASALLNKEVESPLGGMFDPVILMKLLSEAIYNSDDRSIEHGYNPNAHEKYVSQPCPTRFCDALVVK